VTNPAGVHSYERPIRQRGAGCSARQVAASSLAVHVFPFRRSAE
jgi:hypothetical protein